MCNQLMGSELVVFEHVDGPKGITLTSVRCGWNMKPFGSAQRNDLQAPVYRRTHYDVFSSISTITEVQKHNSAFL